MSGDSFRIIPRWPDQLLYEEGESRQLVLSCLSLDEPPQVIVPSSASWPTAVPSWARVERDTILGRLRASGCLLAAVEGDITTLFSPDGGWALEYQFYPPERAGSWEVLRLKRSGDTTPLVQLPGFHVQGAVRFAPGEIELGLEDNAYRQRWRVRIDLATHTFSLTSQAAARPLSELPALLEQLTTAPASRAEAAPAFTSPRTGIGDAWLVTGSLLFVAAGLWLLWKAERANDRWLALLGIVFFGLCAASPWLSRRAPRRRE